MKKIFLILLAISIILYFGSSLAFPVLGEGVVVPVMIISAVVGVISILGFIITLIIKKK